MTHFVLPSPLPGNPRLQHKSKDDDGDAGQRQIEFAPVESHIDEGTTGNEYTDSFAKL